METEVKYLVNGNLEAIEKKLIYIYRDLKYQGEIDLPAIYFDTVDGQLAKSESIIRIREEGEKWVGCYKAKTSYERQFIEEEIRLTLREKDGTNWIQRLENYRQIEDIIGDNQIDPVLKIDTKRKIFILKEQELYLEIVLDKVKYQEGLVCENRVEVELKNGSLEKFEYFVSNFAECFPELQETTVSKYLTAKKLL